MRAPHTVVALRNSGTQAIPPPSTINGGTDAPGLDPLSVPGGVPFPPPIALSPGMDALVVGVDIDTSPLTGPMPQISSRLAHSSAASPCPAQPTRGQPRLPRGIPRVPPPGPLTRRYPNGVPVQLQSVPLCPSPARSPTPVLLNPANFPVTLVGRYHLATHIAAGQGCAALSVNRAGRAVAADRLAKSRQRTAQVTPGSRSHG